MLSAAVVVGALRVNWVFLFALHSLVLLYVLKVLSLSSIAVMIINLFLQNNCVSYLSGYKTGFFSL